MKPLVSVVIAAYKRPDLLRRAVASVQAQTFPDWELVISDDEDPPGAVWEYLQELSRTDARVRVFRNPGPHGQAANVNHAFSHARGTWFKLLDDDDRFKPDCLAAFIDAVRGQEEVALVSCLADDYYDGALVRRGTPRGRGTLERVPQRYVHLGMYLQDIDLGIPVQVMVHRSAVEGGALMESFPGRAHGIDSWWYARVLQHGDLLFLNQSLVERHQGSYGTVTASTSVEALDEEFRFQRQDQLSLIDPSLRPPSLSVVLQMLRLIRAMYYMAHRRPGPALRRLSGAWHPLAWILAARWGLNKRFPGRFAAVPRVLIRP